MKQSTYISRILLLAASLISPQIIASTEASADIAIVDNAKIFADFRDQTPAVINYFSKQTENELTSFYQNAYGEPLSQERKRGRLMLKYQHNDKNIRVIISEQNKHRQVDILVQ